MLVLVKSWHPESFVQLCLSAFSSPFHRQKRLALHWDAMAPQTLLVTMSLAVVETISTNVAMILFETHYMTYLVLRDFTPSKLLPCSVWVYLATSAFVQPIC